MTICDLKPVRIETDYAARDRLLKQQVLANREAVRKGTLRAEDLRAEARHDVAVAGLWAGVRAHTSRSQTEDEPGEGA